MNIRQIRDLPFAMNDSVSSDAALIDGRVHVRLARDLNDVDTMITIGRRLLTESRFRDLPYDEVRLRQSLEHGLHHGSPALFIAERNNQIIGMAIVVVSEYFFSSVKAATIQLIYVVPEARGSMAAIRLLKAIRRIAADAGAHDMHLNVITAITPAKTDRFLRKMGFKQTGGNYILENIGDIADE